MNYTVIKKMTWLNIKCSILSVNNNIIFIFNKFFLIKIYKGMGLVSIYFIFSKIALENRYKYVRFGLIVVLFFAICSLSTKNLHLIILSISGVLVGTEIISINLFSFVNS